METTIEIAGLRKRYGTTKALDGMTFTAGPGQVTGFAGPNGAGKSTTMRVLLGLDRADAGVALIAGLRYVDLKRPMRLAGALLDPNALDKSRTGRNHLLWIARSQGLGAKRVDEVLALVGLNEVGRRRAGGYSLGMRQRLGLAVALLGDPPVLVLDEPFNGLDPAGIAWIRGLLRSLAAEGRAILVASHLMGEMQDLAERVVMVGHGRVLAAQSVGELVASYRSLEGAYLELTRDSGGIR